MEQAPVIRDGPPRVLLVNVTMYMDNIEHFKLFSEVLEYQVKVIGRVGVEIVDGEYDVIVQMGLGDEGPRKMDGLRILAALRRRFPEVPILLISAHPDETERNEALIYGADDYLYRRSVDVPAQLVFRLNTLIGTRHVDMPPLE